MTNDPPYTRRQDPATSHEAARVAALGLKQNQMAVEAFARSCGAEGFTDRQLARYLEDAGSGARSRRAELSARRIVVWSGRTRQDLNHNDQPGKFNVWIHRDFATGVGAVLSVEEAAKRPQNIAPEVQTECMVTANKLESLAKSVRAQGLIGCEQIALEAAELLRRFGP